MRTSCAPWADFVCPWVGHKVPDFHLFFGLKSRLRRDPWVGPKGAYFRPKGSECSALKAVTEGFGSDGAAPVGRDAGEEHLA